MLPIQSLLRRGGVLQGPRLIAAILVVIVFFFYIASPSQEPADISGRPIPAPGYGSQHGGKDIVQEVTDKQREKDQDSLSNKFFDYLGSHKRPKPSPSAAAATATAAAHNHGAAGSIPPYAAGDPACEVFARGADDLVVVLKTGASELYSQLPSRVLTNLRCANLALFSTVDHTIGPYKVHDALANVTSKVRDAHREFELYMKIQSASRAFQDISNFKDDGDLTLEKWTLIPSLVAAYNMNPNKAWFVYVDGDTYLSLPNLLSWIGQMDPAVPFYAGSEVLLEGIELGSSSSGLILSNAAAKALAHSYKIRQTAWEELTATRCCGDQVLAEALKESNIILHRSFPNVQRESPLSLEWNPRHWCKAAVTWHSMSPALMDMLWQFERNWTLLYASADYEPTETELEKRDPAPKATTTTSALEDKATAPPAPLPEDHDFTSSIGIPPILYKDYFFGFLLPLMRASQNRTDWDNFSSSLTYTDHSRGSSYAHSSPDTCRAACDIREKCVQYAHEPNKCRLGTTVRIGEPVPHDKQMKSGWLVHRVEHFGRKLGECDAEDPFSMPDRIKLQDSFVSPEEEEQNASWKPKLDDDEGEDGGQEKTTSEGDSEPQEKGAEEGNRPEKPEAEEKI
jgi:hypothetical protein